MSRPRDNEELAELLERVAELEQRLRDAVGQDEQHHPELLSKEIAALRGKVAAMYEHQQMLALQLDHIRTLVEALHVTSLN